MGEDAKAGAGDEPVILVEVTPRDFRRRGWVLVVVGLVMVVVSIGRSLALGRSVGSPGIGVAAMGYGLYCLVQARRQVTRSLLRIDRTGIRSADGPYDQPWRGVVMVWVGSSTGLRLPFVGEPVLSVFTRTGIEFAARAGTRPKALWSVPVGRPWNVEKLCTELRSITGATVVNGHEVSRSSAARGLR